jgi:hypothetical protein
VFSYGSLRVLGRLLGSFQVIPDKQCKICKSRKAA